MSRPIALLTDFGLRDTYVGVMKAAVVERLPDARLVDLCHEVPPQNVRRAAFLLLTAVPYLPRGTVCLVVVDPGVGTERRPIALAAGDYRFVGPDNGVFAWALRELARRDGRTLAAVDGRLPLAAGGRAVELTERGYWRPEVSSTFHGRDLFGPVAAALAAGVALERLGRPIDWLVDLAWPEPRRTPTGVRGEVLEPDGYGNLITNLRPEHLPGRPRFEIGGRRIEGLATSFQSDRPLVALIGSSGFVELAAPNGNAATLLAANAGTPVRVESG